MIKRPFSSEHKLYAFNAWYILVLLATKTCLAAERYNIYREKMSNDRFRIPEAICKDQKCDSFYAKNTDKACECLCDLNDGKRSTLALSNRTWSCSYDRELRLREGCTMLFFTEQLDSPLAVISLNIQQHLMVSKWPVQHCTIDPLNANYQDCDGKWIPIQNADQKFSYGAVWLQIRTDTISEDFSYLNGKLIKLGFNCKAWATETLIRECVLFKFTGNVSCPAPTKPNPSTRPITTDLSPKPTSVSATTKSEATTLVKTMRTHDTTKSASETMRSTLSTLKTMTRSTVRGTRRLTRVHSSKKVAETRTITLSPTSQERVSTSVLHNVTTGEKDRGQNEGNSESIFTIIASTIAAVLVVIATLTAALVIVRRRKQESGSAKNIKSPFRSVSLKVERGKSNESLISVQSAASAANNEVFLEPGDSEYQRKQELQSDSDKNKNYEKSCEPNEKKTEELGSPSSGYESLRSYHSYECLTNQNTNLFSGEYSYAKYDGPMNDKSPVYYVLEGPNPNSSGANKETLSETKSRKTSHTYDNVERLDAFDEVYATIDETDLNSLSVTSPQSPVYVELDSSLTEEIEI